MAIQPNREQDRVIRSIVGFDRKSGDFVEQFILGEVKLEVLRKIVNEGPENPLYDMWPLDEYQLAELRQYFHGTTDTKRNQYYLDAYCDPIS